MVCWAFRPDKNNPSSYSYIHENPFLPGPRNHRCWGSGRPGRAPPFGVVSGAPGAVQSPNIDDFWDPEPWVFMNILIRRWGSIQRPEPGASPAEPVGLGKYRLRIDGDVQLATADHAWNLTPTSYSYNHENFFSRDTAIIDFWGIGRPR